MSVIYRDYNDHRTDETETYTVVVDDLDKVYDTILKDMDTRGELKDVVNSYVRGYTTYDSCYKIGLIDINIYMEKNIDLGASLDNSPEFIKLLETRKKEIDHEWIKIALKKKEQADREKYLKFKEKYGWGE